MQSVLLVIQARCGSTRLPGKVCLEVVPGVSLLGCLIRRLRSSKTVTQIVVATSDLSQDDPIETIARAESVEIFRGSESDVLQRFAGAANAFPSDYIVRICADSPIHDGEVVDQCVKNALAMAQYDYVSNMHPETYPYGLAVEVLPRKVLLHIAEIAKEPMEREHVTYYIAAHPDQFKTLNVEHNRDLSHLRVVVDYPEDFALAKEIYRELYQQNNLFSWKDAVRLLEWNPALVAINAERNDRLPNRPTAVNNNVLPGHV